MKLGITPRYSREEEAQLASLASAGCKQSREKLVISQLPWAARICKTWIRRGLQADDARSVAWMAVVMAVDDFEPHRARLCTFVWQKCRRELNAALKYTTAITLDIRADNKDADFVRRGVRSLDVSTGAEGVPLSRRLQSNGRSVVDISDAREQHHVMMGLIRRLPSDMRVVIRMRRRGCSLREIAAQVGCSIELVRVLENRAIESLQHRWERRRARNRKRLQRLRQLQTVA